MPSATVDQLPLFREARLHTVNENDPVGTVVQFRFTELPLLLTLVILMLAGAVGIPKTKLPCGTGTVWLTAPELK